MRSTDPEWFTLEGQMFEHTKTGKRYRVIGRSWNAATDAWDVLYVPLYDSEISVYSRPLADHPKAWLTRLDDGVPRYRRIDEE